MINFHELSVTGLFGRFNVTIPIKDNRIIIVGNNGIGKSTILNAFCYVISTKWEKLRELHFESIRIKVDNETFTIERRWLDEVDLHFPLANFDSTSLFRRRRGVTHLISNLNYRELKALSYSKTTDSEIEAIANRIGLPISIIGDIRKEIQNNSINFDESVYVKLKKIEDYFDEKLGGKILHLPTYRRIEKDIGSIFPEIEEEFQEALASRRRRRIEREDDSYIELVDFGMEDVQNMIKDKMEFLGHLALNEIRSLSTRYLSDVIRDKANSFESERVQDFDKDRLQRMFANVDESLLSKSDQNEIYDVVEKIKKNKQITRNERYVAHYISYLIDIREKIDAREKSVNEFVRICNSYLFKKRFEFDNAGYLLPIRYGEDQTIRMEALSSGEKQIVSLFAHMTLETNPMFYVIIDEPELSLSVNWQKRFLQDISKLESCAFVGAVTHSPFIFDNELDDHAVNMISCIEERNHELL